MTSGPRETPESSGVWPAYVRYPLLAVLAGVVLVGVIVVLYDAGWLPIAGPFAAVVIAAVIVAVVTSWRARTLRRLSATATEQLRGVAPAVGEERARPAAARPTRASDESLDLARTQADAALAQLTGGQAAGAVAPLAQLRDLAQRDWVGEASLTRQVAELGRTATDMERVVRRMRKVAAQRRGQHS